MLLDRHQSVLIVIDVQARLLPGVHEQAQLVSHCNWLTRLARLLGVPVIGSEQYPQGLGHTEDSLRAAIGADNLYGKTRFACADDEAFARVLQALKRPQLVLCGMETHACILQSALRLLEQDYQVFVVADAVSARQPFDTDIALRRMERAGVNLITREAVGFEWLRGSDDEHFRTFSREFLR